MISINLQSNEIKISRLELYEKYLRKFDLIEKNLEVYNYSKKDFNAAIYSKINLTGSKSHILFLSILLEILGLQRFMFLGLSKKNSKITLLKIIIRKKLFFPLLEICVNSIFLNKLNSLNFSSVILLHKMHFFFPSNVVNNLNFSLDDLFISNILLLFNKNNQFGVKYLIPVKNF